MQIIKRRVSYGLLHTILLFQKIWLSGDFDLLINYYFISFNSMNGPITWSDEHFAIINQSLPIIDCSIFFNMINI